MYLDPKLFQQHDEMCQLFGSCVTVLSYTKVISKPKFGSSLLRIPVSAIRCWCYSEKLHVSHLEVTWTAVRRMTTGLLDWTVSIAIVYKKIVALKQLFHLRNYINIVERCEVNFNFWKCLLKKSKGILCVFLFNNILFTFNW